MKKLYFILTIILLAVTNTLQAQNDSIYFWKSGAMIHKQSIKTIDLDSITFTAPDVNPNPNPSTIIDILVASPDFTIFVSALMRAGLVNTLGGSGSFTVFAPTNAAFIDSGITPNIISALPESDIPALKELLLNHFLLGVVQSSDFINLNNSYIKTLGRGSASSTNTLSMYVSTISGVRLNGISDVTTADIQATNGIIHIVDAVIPLPTITNHLITNPEFSTLVSVLTRDGQPDFAALLSGTANSPFTIFAPVNPAFTALDAELAPGGIAGVSANNITSILQYHVVASANVLSIALTDGLVITSISGQTFQFSFTGGPRIRDAQNRLSSIILTDIQCSNGVIHALGRVLLPTF